MKLESLQKRLNALMPEPGQDPEEAENDRLLIHAFEAHFLKRLQELDCSCVVEEMKAALATIGPRPFGHTRPDDRPYWVPIDDVIGAH